MYFWFRVAAETVGGYIAESRICVAFSAADGAVGAIQCKELSVVKIAHFTCAVMAVEAGVAEVITVLLHEGCI